METNEKQTPDPEELEMKDLLEKAFEIAKKKELPFLCLTTVPSIEHNLIIACGYPHCITNLVRNSLGKDPILQKIITSGLALHMLDKDDKSVLVDIDTENIVNHARKNTPAGN